MGWKIYDEAIEMVSRQHRYFPSVFRWRGQRYEVEQVSRCHTVVRRGWRGGAARHYFEVRCTAGQFELFQEIKDGTWHLRRARLESAAAPLVRQTAAAWR